ncbi:MAG: hypothetical protein GX101_04215 [Firmicutes bacterium]|jgi:hypothetical protein|nr:DUF5665 domain-containing protein [Bacillota bacterium]NLO65876.1 hypothetical protein [Bacillota bacterium]
MAGKVESGLLQALLAKIEELILSLERANMAEYIQLWREPRRLLYLNFLAGIARGFGLAIGFTVVGAFFLYGLGKVASWNLPIVGEFVAEIARIVQNELAHRP